MADLEDLAVKRDKRFLVRLVLALLVGLIAGLFVYGELTDPGMGNCAADAFRGVAGEGEESAPDR